MSDRRQFLEGLTSLPLATVLACRPQFPRDYRKLEPSPPMQTLSVRLGIPREKGHYSRHLFEDYLGNIDFIHDFRQR